MKIFIVCFMSWFIAQVLKVIINYVKYLVGKVSMIESVDSVSLAQEISRRSEKTGVITDILCEVNTGREQQKGGFLPEELSAVLEEISKMKKVSPEKKDLVETRVIDGVKFILVRADGGVELNGVNIEIK